jgi:hypothetical protein
LGYSAAAPGGIGFLDDNALGPRVMATASDQSGATADDAVRVKLRD